MVLPKPIGAAATGGGAQPRPEGTLIWAGDTSDLRYALLQAGTDAPLYALPGNLDRLITERESTWAGLVLPTELSAQALPVCEKRDGLSKAIAGIDTIAWVKALPEPFGFACLTGGIVQALRETVPEGSLGGAALLENFPAAHFALPALIQLGFTPYGIARGALARAAARLGVGIEAPSSLSTAPMLRLSRSPQSPHLIHVEIDGTSVPLGLVELHTAGAQIRLLTSREPTLSPMYEVLSERFPTA